MPYRLRDRQRQIPGGMFFYQPQTKWKSQPGSFSNIVQQIISHRQANPWLNLPTDIPTVENEFDLFCGHVCATMNWTDYYVSADGGPPPPLPPPPPVSRVSQLAAGAKAILVDWLAAGAEAVPKEKAEERAKICVACPQNQKGDLLDFFTTQATEAIRKALNSRLEMKLETSQDEALGVCKACSCPLHLKVNMPIERIRNKLKPEIIARLDPGCWIPKE